MKNLVRLVLLALTLFMTGCVSTAHIPNYSGALPPLDQEVELRATPAGSKINRYRSDTYILRVWWVSKDGQGVFDLRVDGSEKAPELSRVLYPRGVGLFQDASAIGFITAGDEGEVFLTPERVTKPIKKPVYPTPTF
jgi:hypothetical protein